MLRPPFTPRELIGLGAVPGPRFKALVEEVNGSAVARGARGPEAAEAALAALLAPHLAPATRPLREPAPLRSFLTAAAGDEDERRNADDVTGTLRALLRTPTTIQGLAMPDACPSGPLGTIPVGGVVAARGAIHPGMHSADVCCSMMLTEIGDVDPARVMDLAHELALFGPGGWREPVARPSAALEARLRANPFLRGPKALDRAHHHLRTQGDGNHFLFVGRSEATGAVTLVSHHGSRGLGAELYRAGLEAAERHRRRVSPETLPQNAWIELASQEGADYWDALEAVHDWTVENHEALHDEVLRRLGRDGAGRLFTPHNFVFRDEREPDVLHHAKGSTPVDPRLLRRREGRMVIPMNMAEPVLVVEAGAGGARFAPHGAGRLLSRTAFLERHAHLSPEEMMARDIGDAPGGLDLRFWCGRADLSELPSAYKSARRVQEDMALFDLARVVDRIVPYGSIMAGDVEADAPWRKRRDLRAAARDGSRG